MPLSSRLPRPFGSQSASSSTRVSKSRRCGPRSEHSPTVARRQFASPRAMATSRSRVRLRVIFERRNSVRVPGSQKSGQSWPCQKAAVNEDYGAKLQQDDIGLSRQSRVMDAVAEAERAERLPDGEFDLVFRPRIPNIMRLCVAGSTISVKRADPAAARRRPSTAPYDAQRQRLPVRRPHCRTVCTPACRKPGSGSSRNRAGRIP